MIDQTISHYKITGKLGAGGMGVVYKALDLKLERTVALKFLSADVAVSERDKENLLREARAASALDHSNIGVIYGLEESDDRQLYIVMGYYEGETLAQKISRGLLPLREALDLLIQIAGGLSAAHARNIVHRDIKPSNIIITNDHVAKIVDFGLARVVASSSATQSLQISGTLPYMAPEQVLGEPIDPRCDVWALGVILVQMITGSHPFLRDNTAAMTFAILNQPPAALDVLSPVLQPIAYRALSKKPEHRYPNAKEMLGDLEMARLQIIAAPSGTAQEAATLTSAVSARELKEFAEHASTPRWQTATPQKPTSRRGLYVFFVGVLLAVASLLVPQVRERLAGLLTASRENHIAVLPFDNIGNDPANEAVAQGLMDSLTSELSNLSAAQQSLWVVPASIVRSHKITDPSAAFHELGATVVVKGSVQRAGQIVHLTVDLIDARNLRQIGSAALEDRAGDLAALQDESVARLARLLKINVSAGMLRATGGNVAPAAYESYLKALGYMQRYDKPGNLDLAIGALNDSVKADPRFALGFAGLGQAFHLKYVVDQNPKWIDEASANCNQAIQLDDHLPAVYETLGRIHDASGKYDLAVQEYQHALQLDARNAEALSGLARAYESAGRVKESEAALQRAVALKPDYWDGYNSLGLFYDRQGKYDDSIIQLRRAIELTPDNAQAYLNLGAVYSDTGDPNKMPDAVAALKKSIEISPSYAAYANLGYVESLKGNYAEAAAMTEKALQLNDKNYEVWRNLAENYRWMNQREKASATEDRELSLLEAALKVRSQDAGAWSEMATIHAGRKLREKAQVEIGRALALAPQDAGVLVDAGEVFEDLGNRAEAIRSTQEGLNKGFSIEDLKRRYGLQAVLHDPSFQATVKK